MLGVPARPTDAWQEFSQRIRFVTQGLLSAGGKSQIFCRFVEILHSPAHVVIGHLLNNASFFPCCCCCYCRCCGGVIVQVLAARIFLTSLKGFDRDYILGKQLGQGAFATVFSATQRGAPAGSSEVFAVKRTTRKELSKDDETDLLKEVRT